MISRSNTSSNNELAHERTEQLNEILGGAPRFQLVSGTLISLLVLLLLLIASLFIQYPDVVVGDFRMAATQEPHVIIANYDNRIAKMLVSEMSIVKRGQLLGFMESNASPYEILRVEELVRNLKLVVEKNQLPDLFKDTLPLLNNLGELHRSYQSVINQFRVLRAFYNDGINVKKMMLIEDELKNLTGLSQVLTNQKKLLEQDLEIAIQDFKVQEALYKDKVISFINFKAEESKLISKRLPVENIHATILNNNNTRTSKERELLSILEQLDKEKSALEQLLGVLESEIYDWKQRFLLVAYCDGIIKFPGALHKGQFVKSQQKLFYIFPKSWKYIGEIKLNQDNYGKLNRGQRVLVNLSGFPWQEFGKLEGHVNSISEIPDEDDKFLITIVFDKGMLTDQNKQLVIKNGLTGKAEIIVRSSMLLSKLSNTVSRVFKSTQSEKTSYN